MPTVYSKKAAEVLDTPLMLFECILSDGVIERWCTHKVVASGQPYEARLLNHSGFEVSLLADSGVDTAPRFSLILSNVDGRISQIERGPGFKGANLKISLGFFDIRTGQATTDLQVLYLGVANSVDELTESTAKLTFTNRLMLSRLAQPSLRIQSRCPWRFPSTEAERRQAVSGGALGEYSSFYRCGYSPDQENGVGNPDANGPFTSCNYTREDCQARGMFDRDSLSRPTARFGGFGFLPASTLVRASGVKSWTSAEVIDGRARSNDAAPLVYGTAWIKAPVIFARNDGNLTRYEAVVSSGPIEGILRVLADGVEIPLGQSGKDMTATGWYNVLSLGERNGAFDLYFTDQNGKPEGEPHGSVSVLALVLPNRLAGSGGLPRVEVLLNGLKLRRYDLGAQVLPASFSRNPAWVLLDLLCRSGWREDELDLQSFAKAAFYCDDLIDVLSPDGSVVKKPRFELNLPLTERRSLNEIVKGIRSACCLMLALNRDGKLNLHPESSMAVQQPSLPPGSNAHSELLGGWPAYEFGDGTNGLSGILRSANGEPTFRMWSRPASETPNRFTAEFQDAFQGYRQESLSIVDFEDVAKQGVEVSSAYPAWGLPHIDQAERVLRLQLLKSVSGNRIVEFGSSVQAFGLQPGDLITLTHSREGLNRSVFRVMRLVASQNYETVHIVARLHSDSWYGPIIEGSLTPNRWRGRSDLPTAAPRALSGAILGADGRQDFQIDETSLVTPESDPQVELAVQFTPPRRPEAKAPAPPIVSLIPAAHREGGSHRGGQTLYYALSSVDAAGAESALSFLVTQNLPGGSDTWAVELEGISLPRDTATMRVYRGTAADRLLLIGAGLPPASSFLDTGFSATLAPPPDPAYHHAAFYWRFELLPEAAATIFGPASVGNSSLALQPDEFAGSIVRITRGKGEGQERLISSNDSSTILVREPWAVAPDATSSFTIADPTWQFGGLSFSDEIRFLVPLRRLESVQILGLAVDARDTESARESAIVSRHEISAGGSPPDQDVPPEPLFALSTTGQGDIEIGGIGFGTTENTRTIQTGTFTLHYWDELQSPSSYSLAAPASASATEISLNQTQSVSQGDLIQLDAELVRILEVSQVTNVCQVERGVHGTVPGTYLAGLTVYPLQRRTGVLAFPKGFFGSEASGSYLERISLPNARVAAAEMYMTNRWGAGPTGAQAYSMLLGGGLRTMAGGQYNIVLEGELAVETSIAPPIVVGATSAVRDVTATVGLEPIGAPVELRLWVSGQIYSNLTIPAGSRNSTPVEGFGKPPLNEGAKLTAEIQSVGMGSGTFPGRDLTITIRT